MMKERTKDEKKNNGKKKRCNRVRLSLLQTRKRRDRTTHVQRALKFVSQEPAWCPLKNASGLHIIIVQDDGYVRPSVDCVSKIETCIRIRERESSVQKCVFENNNMSKTFQRVMNFFQTKIK